MFEFFLIIIGLMFGIAIIFSAPTSIVFIGLKLMDIIKWSWGETLIPLFILIFCGISLYIMKLYSMFD